MARPSAPTVIDTITPTGDLIEVLVATGVFVVCYNGKPISLRINADTVPDYPKTMFANQGTARMLARKLNAYFDCDHFTVSQFA